MNQSYIVHPKTKTRYIIKSTFISADETTDEACITAYSYDIAPRIELVPVRGGDGRIHNVPVNWDEYLPLEEENHFYITANDHAEGKTVLARRNGLCIYS